MARARFRRNSAGVAEMLKSAGFAAAVREHAEAIASNVRERRPEAEVVVDEYTYDRAAASVTVKHWRALQWQAEDGDLTQAAASRGLDVSARGV